MLPPDSVGASGPRNAARWAWTKASHRLLSRLGACLLVARIHQIGERLEGVGGGQAGVAVRRRDVHGGVDQDGVDQLRDAHVLQHLPHVAVRQVVPVLCAQRGKLLPRDVPNTPRVLLFIDSGGLVRTEQEWLIGLQSKAG